MFLSFYAVSSKQVSTVYHNKRDVCGVFTSSTICNFKQVFETRCCYVKKKGTEVRKSTEI